MSFSIQTRTEAHPSGSLTEYVLAGILDENAQLDPIRAAQGAIAIHFRGVTRTNSCGVRDWIQALSQAKVTSIAYRECPMPIVKQLNAVPAFVVSARVESFYAPYFCEPCDQDQLCLLTLEESAGGAPARRCPKCQQPMKFDAIPAQYLAFAKRMAPGA